MNSVILVGRLTSDPEVKENGDNSVTNIILAVTRNFKNAEGTYDTDFIKIVLWNNIAKAAGSYCQKGDVVGIKGRIAVNSYEDEEKNKHYVTEIIGEKITFLSSNNKNKEVETKEENE